MKYIKKIFLISCLVIILSTSFSSNNSQKVYAASIFGFSDKQGCESKDPFLPNLLICGRNPESSNGCYSDPCNLGDLVETGSRIILWLLTIALLIVPIFVMYFGAQMIIAQQMPDLSGPVNLKNIKDNLWKILLYFILMLAAWLIVKTVVDVFQVNDAADRVPIFLLDKNGTKVQVKQFNTN